MPKLLLILSYPLCFLDWFVCIFFPRVNLEGAFGMVEKGLGWRWIAIQVEVSLRMTCLSQLSFLVNKLLTHQWMGKWYKIFPIHFLFFKHSKHANVTYRNTVHLYCHAWMLLCYSLFGRSLHLLKIESHNSSFRPVLNFLFLKIWAIKDDRYFLISKVILRNCFLKLF